MGNAATRNLAHRNYQRNRRSALAGKAKRLEKKLFAKYDADRNGALDREEVRLLATELLNEFTPLTGGLSDGEVDLIMRCGGPTAKKELRAEELPQALAVAQVVKAHNKELVELFGQYDVDGTGVLPQDQLRAFLTDLNDGHVVGETDVRFILHQCGADRDGTMALRLDRLKAALACWYVLLVRPKVTDQIKDAFSRFDASATGYLTRAEMRAMLISLGVSHKASGHKWTREHYDILFDQVDTNGDGKLDYAEFADWLMDGAEEDQVDEEDDEDWLTGCWV
eukprot:TRINITY_DN73243_c0_g1_i1.p1 TRINITY_DN73243_c0_g1~~TRINITY_DN73243_c0_g1_i1.p1  ORF type:complete len:296 (-),score=48.38 TRINITY_DN73243_c0_g1_i1:70-912(-)